MKQMTIKRTAVTIVGLLLVTVLAASAAQEHGQNAPVHIPPFPKTLTNAHYVYVTSYDGGQYNKNLLPEDRQAIAAVQNALRKSGKFAVVYEPRQAEMVITVQSRGNEDVLAVYDAHDWRHNGAYLWRVMDRGGLQKDAPLLSEFFTAFNNAKTK